MLSSKAKWEEEILTSNESQISDIHPTIEQLIIKRKLATPETLANFLTTEGISHDPFLMKDMKKSVDRIKKAIELKEPILIYGDYDADGVTATSILVKCLRELGAFVDFYIPNRFYEGYGPNEDAFMQAISDGFKVIITVDNGISGIEEANLLLEHGVDLIITDHHQVKETMPKAFSIIHPELEHDYPFDYLAGAGVALKLAEALTNLELDEDYYAIAALGTVGDIVNLIDENRYIVKRGLKALRKTEMPGLKALMELAGTNQKEADEVNIGFEICPRLNAPGRMEDASLAVELLVTEDENDAAMIAGQIESFNQERQNITQQTVDEALKLVDNQTLIEKKVLILYQSHWHEGILGIVAGKLSKLWDKAVILLTDDHEGYVKGSARAVEGYQLFELLDEFKDLIIKFGGHALAAGLTLDSGNIQPLEDKMNKKMENVLIEPTLNIDVNISLQDASIEFINQLNYLAPFGAGNRAPLVRLANVKVKHVKKIGNRLQHLKFTIYNDSLKLDGIAFNQSEIAIYLTPETQFDFVGELQINEWNGKRSVQMRVIDLRCNEFQLIDLRSRQTYEQFKDELRSTTLFSNLNNQGEKVKDLMVDHLPVSKESLLNTIKEVKPENVIIIPYESVPTVPREKFVGVYKIIKQHAPFTLNEQIYNYFIRLGVSKNELLFILQVFFEIELVIIKDATVSIIENSVKRDLSEAPTYKSQKSKQIVLEFLELSTGVELRELFNSARTC